MSFRQRIARAAIRASGWHCTTEELPEKVIVLGAPHTSNWDAIFMLLAFWEMDRTPSFLVKDSAVKVPVLGRIVKAVGGIAVERSAHHGLVGSIVDRIAQSDQMAICITPKGTRSRRDYWKSGFYRIALESGLPVELGFVDASTKTFGWTQRMNVTGDVAADMNVIRDFYEGKAGVREELTCTPRLRAEEDGDARDYLLSGLPR